MNGTGTAMNRYLPGNRITLLRDGAQYLSRAGARHRRRRAAKSGSRPTSLRTTRRGAWSRRRFRARRARGVRVRVLVDGWGAKLYLTPALQRDMTQSGIELMKYRPEVAPWQFRSHRLRRLHRKLCQVDGRIAFVGGINIIDDMNTPHHKPPRADFAVSVEGPLLPAIEQTMQRVWALVQLVQSGASEVPLFPERRHVERVGTQTAKFVARDNLRHRRDIEHAYLAAIRTAKSDIIIANSYFFPGIRFRRALAAAARARRHGDAAAAGQGRIPAAAFRVARDVRAAAAGGRHHPGVSPQHAARQGRGGRRSLGHGRLVEHRSLQPADGARSQRVRARPRIQRRTQAANLPK